MSATTTAASNKRIPAVSVGMPVYNAEATLPAAIESILAQSFTDFELIISDNASTDSTAAICKAYASKDDRISVIRQAVNVGAEKNFRFVLNQARGEYFMWAAADDTRTSGFIERNVDILRVRPNCVFSSAPNCFEGEENQPEKRRTFELSGSVFQRLSGFLDRCWVSHACFYALVRRETLIDCPYMPSAFLAADWLTIVHLLLYGGFARSTDQLLVLGCAGESMQPRYIQKSRQQGREYLFPFYRFSQGFMEAIFRNNAVSWPERFLLMGKLVRFNCLVSYRLVRDSIASNVKGAGRRILSIVQRGPSR